MTPFKPSVCLSHHQFVCPSATVLFAYCFFTIRDRAFIIGMCVPNDKTFPMVPYILSTWPLTYIWKTLTLHIHFLTIRHRAFIFAVCVLYDKICSMVLLILSTWPWLWRLTYIWTTLTLRKTSLPYDIGLSYLACVLLSSRPFLMLFAKVCVNLKYCTFKWNRPYSCKCLTDLNDTPYSYIIWIY